MPPKSLLIAVALLLFTAPAAHAQSSQVKKASKAMAAYNNGDRDQLATARSAINLAASHPKTGALSGTWVLRGHIYLQNLLDPDLGGTSAKPAEVAVKAFTQAVEIGVEDADREPLVRDLKALQSAVQTAVFDNVERRLWSSAYSQLTLAISARDLLEKLDAKDDQRDASLSRLSVLVTTHTEKLDEAQAHHRAFLRSGEFDASLTSQLAQKLREKESIDVALAFLRKVRKDRLDEPTLLSTEVEILLGAERTDDALKVLDAVSDSIGEGVGPQLLLAKLYARAGNTERSEAAYRAVLARDPEVQEALVPMARFVLASVAEIDATLEGRAADGEPPRKLKKAEREALEADRTEQYTSVAAILEKARKATPEDREILELLQSVYDALEDDENSEKIATALENLE